jgi:hypothetical protein
MNHKGLIRIILSLSIITIVACSGFAQQKPQGQTPEGKASESATILVIGKIEYLQSEGGYFIRGDHPYARIFKIANQNPDVLEPLLKIGNKHVYVDGRLTAGTNILFIEKIEGKPYTGR